MSRPPVSQSSLKISTSFVDGSLRYKSNLLMNKVDTAAGEILNFSLITHNDRIRRRQTGTIF